MKTRLLDHRLLVTMLAFLLIVLLVAAGFAFGSSRSPTPSLVWHDNTTRNRSCANGAQLTNSNESFSSETIACGPKPTTTTTLPTSTTTTLPTTTTTQPGGTCTNPIDSSSNANASFNVDDGHDWVSNDAWSGSHGPQTINVCSASSWDAVSTQADNQGQIETYPDTEYDVGGRDNQSTTPISGYTSITSTFSEAFPASGWSGDAAYDLWTNNWQHELMLWQDVRGTQTYWSNCAEPGPDFNTCGLANAPIAVTLDGVPYHFFSYGTKGSNAENVFVRDTFVTSGSVGILAAYNWEVANGWASASQNPTQLEFGVEIASTTGTQTFPVTGFSVSLSPTQGAILRPSHKARVHHAELRPTTVGKP